MKRDDAGREFNLAIGLFDTVKFISIGVSGLTGFYVVSRNEVKGKNLSGL